MFEPLCPFEDENRQETPIPNRIWWRQFLALNLVATAGLATRKFHLLPAFLGKYPGDALWATMVFFLFGLVLSRRTTTRIAVLSLLACWAVEFSQMLHWPWLETLRSHYVGYLILGTTFNAPDLLAYTTGIALGVGIERAGWISGGRPGSA